MWDFHPRLHFLHMFILKGVLYLIIAFWSPDGENCLTSTHMLGISLAASVNWKETILLMENVFDNGYLSGALKAPTQNWIREPLPYYCGEGLNYLIYRSQNHMLNSAMVKEGLVWVRENLAYIPAVKRKNEAFFQEDFLLQYHHILSTLETAAHHVFIDCRSGMHKQNQTILSSADIIVVSIKQSRKSFDSCLQSLLPFQNKLVFLLGNYQAESIYSPHYLCRTYRIRRSSMSVIPYNAEFEALIKKGKSLSFFLSPVIYKKTYLNEEFIRYMNKAYYMILKISEINHSELPV